MEKANQMQPGTWDKIGTEDYKPEDKIKFEVNITQKVIVLNPVPKECVGDDGGIYYTFEMEQDSKPKILQTSAWTLLKEFKKASLKAGMVLEITKRLVKGKQFFEVKVL